MWTTKCNITYHRPLCDVTHGQKYVITNPFFTFNVMLLPMVSFMHLKLFSDINHILDPNRDSFVTQVLSACNITYHCSCFYRNLIKQTGYILA